MADTKPELKTIMAVGYFDNLHLYSSIFDMKYNVVHAHDVPHAIKLIIEEECSPDLVVLSEKGGGIDSIVADTRELSPKTVYALAINEDPTQGDTPSYLIRDRGIMTNTNLGVLRHNHFAYKHLAIFKQPDNIIDLREVIDWIINSKK